METKKVMFFEAPDGAEASTEGSEIDSSVENVFEIVDEVEADPAPAKDPTIQKLEEVYEGLESKLSAKTEAGMDRIGTGLAALGESIKGLVSQQGAKPSESPEEFRARIEKNVFDKPLEVMQEVMQRSAGPINEQIVMNQMRMGRKLVEFELEPTEKALFKKYSGEIEAEFARIPIQDRFVNPEGAYQQAFDLIKVKHLGEIIETERSKAVGEAQKAAPKPMAPAGVLDGGGRRPPAQAATAGKTITLKPGQRDRIKALMARENVSEGMFNSVVEALYDSGELANI